MAVYIDGQDIGQRFTTWENWFRHPGVNRPVPEINSLLFRAAAAGFSEENGGYLFFGETATSGPGPGPPEPDVDVGKQASVRRVHPGGLVRYTITARNRGRGIARNLLACDRIPREETFVSADHRLHRVGRRRCLVIHSLAAGQHMTFHLVARVSRNARAGRIDNTTDRENVDDLTPPPLPPEGDVPGHITDPKPTPEGHASVDVVRPSTPPFTG